MDLPKMQNSEQQSSLSEIMKAPIATIMNLTREIASLEKLNTDLQNLKENETESKLKEKTEKLTNENVQLTNKSERQKSENERLKSELSNSNLKISELQKEMQNKEEFYKKEIELLKKKQIEQEKKMLTYLGSEPVKQACDGFIQKVNAAGSDAEKLIHNYNSNMDAKINQHSQSVNSRLNEIDKNLNSCNKSIKELPKPLIDAANSVRKDADKIHADQQAIAWTTRLITFRGILEVFFLLAIVFSSVFSIWMSINAKNAAINADLRIRQGIYNAEGYSVLPGSVSHERYLKDKQSKK